MLVQKREGGWLNLKTLQLKFAKVFTFTDGPFFYSVASPLTEGFLSHFPHSLKRVFTEKTQPLGGKVGERWRTKGRWKGWKRWKD